MPCCKKGFLTRPELSESDSVDNYNINRVHGRKKNQVSVFCKLNQGLRQAYSVHILLRKMQVPRKTQREMLRVRGPSKPTQSATGRRRLPNLHLPRVHQGRPLLLRAKEGRDQSGGHGGSQLPPAQSGQAQEICDGECVCNRSRLLRTRKEAPGRTKSTERPGDIGRTVTRRRGSRRGTICAAGFRGTRFPSLLKI